MVYNYVPYSIKLSINFVKNLYMYFSNCSEMSVISRSNFVWVGLIQF